MRRPVLDLYHGIRITLNINSSGTKHHFKLHAETSRARDPHTAYPYTYLLSIPATPRTKARKLSWVFHVRFAVKRAWCRCY